MEKRKYVKLLSSNKEEKLLFMDYVIDLIPERQIVFVKPHPYYFDLCNSDKIIAVLPIEIKEKKIFNRIKFEFIKYIKTLPNPEQRVADFECRDDNNVLDLGKMDRLIESRKTKKEKQSDRDYNIYLLELCNFFRTRCGLKQELLKRIK